MNKAEFVKAIAAKCGEKTTLKDAEKMLEAVIGSIEDALANGEKVQLIGFGSFEVRERKERKVTPPGKKDEKTIPATKVPVFKAGKSLKDKVAGM